MTRKKPLLPAAHELRSPLTSIKLQAQALRGSGDPSLQLDAERDIGVARINQGVDRAIKLVEQLLALAREEAAAVSRAALH